VGDLVEDVVVWLEAPPRRGTDTPARVFRRRGGSAANVVSFAALDGSPARFIGRVGDDPLGERLVADLAATGAEVLVQHEGRSGTIVVLVEPGGERTMLPDRGACTELAGVPAEWLDGIAVLHLPAYSLVVEPLGATARSLATQSRHRGALLSIDASSVDVLERFGPGAFRRLLADLAPDVVLANADEAVVLDLAGAPIGRLVVVKSGPAPVTVIDAAGGRTTVPVPQLATVADTTGAGDAFAAGFLAALAAGAGPTDAAVAGNRLAARVLTQPGASLGGDPAPPTPAGGHPA
jgi:sugar/nucleoside kinase (ribokinase family)